MLLRFTDFVTTVLICFAVVFNPWAFGTTESWSIQVMNSLGCTLGVLWLVKCILRRLSGRPPLRWETSPCLAIRLLAVASLLVLLYCLISAINCRATYLPLSWELQYHPVIDWLPHSYDGDCSWTMFWQTLGSAGLFWALRDWLLTMTPTEAAAYDYSNQTPRLGSALAPGRLSTHLRILLWVLAINGTLLAIQGIIQRIGGGDKLLWLAKPRVNGFNIVQFGAFPYRANASQYFNLLWPAILGFGWLELNSRHSPGRVSKRVCLLIGGVVFMAICPLMAASRTGAAVLILNLGIAVAVLWFARQKQDLRSRLAIPVVASIVLAGGFLLGWTALAPRLHTLSDDAQDRASLSQVGWEIVTDNPVYGTGPGSLKTMYQLYMHGWTDFWPVQLHNDWMEILATFGCVGFALIFSCLLLAATHHFFGGGIPAEKYFVRLLWISLSGCLLHARFDWPFECHSVLTLFLVICAILSCLSRPAVPPTSGS